MTPAVTINPTIAAITNDTLSYAPATLAAVLAAEQSKAAGSDKLQAVVDGVLGGTQALEASPNPNVAAISALANLFVSIFNATGLFSHKSTAQ